MLVPQRLLPDLIGCIRYSPTLRHYMQTLDIQRPPENVFRPPKHTQNTKPQAPKWMVYNGKPIKMDDLGGKPLFLETPIWMSIGKDFTAFSSATHVEVLDEIANDI